MRVAGWWLLAGLAGCQSEMASSVPTASPSSETGGQNMEDHGSTSHAVGKGDGISKGGSATTAPSTTAPEDPLADGLDACANGGLGPDAFERALDARLCEEWEACDGTECLPGEGSESGREADEACAFDVAAACDCLESSWTCETSYGMSAELQVVVPAPACFVVYSDCD
jgi:hypothetical protein